MRIALAGNPNSGKTTLFNELTGSNQYVGNWPGVTVEKKEGKLKKDKSIQIIDLPGIYSLSPYTLEEVVTRKFLTEESVDVIINIVDATNLERNLYLTTQLNELGIPMVIALNMMDLVRSEKNQIDSKQLSKLLGCPVVEISALKNQGISELVEAAKSAKGQSQGYFPLYTKEVVSAISKVEKYAKGSYSDRVGYWYSIKLLENDEEVVKQIKISSEDQKDLETLREEIETKYDDDIESIITNQRYQFVTEVRNKVYKKERSNALTISDKIDRIVTNRWLALPIFALIMFLVYTITLSSVGGFVTDWINEVFFPEIVQANVATFLESIGSAEWLVSLIVDGIIGGVGAVLGFVPQIMILFVLISILEDCGYMARVAFIMDRLFRRFGLSGKSFIPMLIGSGCSVPGIMAARTIENEKDRKMTIILTPFIPCSAKLPVFVLMIGAFFPGNPYMMTLLYFMGIGMVILGGLILKRTPAFKGDPAPFVMELPQYHLPTVKNVLRHAWDRGKSFIVKAGTIIFVACGAIWFLQSFNWSFEMVDSADSILASIGNAISPIFAPLGFGHWQATAATITGFLAKETIVATFGILLGVGEVGETDPSLLAALPTIFTQLGAFSFMVFTLYAAPCFAAIGATKREMGSWKWTLFAVLFQTGTAYLVCLLIYQIGSLIL